MSFIEAQLVECPGFGFTGGPEFNTNIHRMKSGRESRNAEWSDAIHRYSAPYNAMFPAAYMTMKSAFMACRGSSSGFRFKDWSDFEAVGVSLGLAPSGSTPVQLVIPYEAFGAVIFTRTIKKPVAGTVTVYQNGVPKAGTIDTTTGIFTPSSGWSVGQSLTADFEFDVPVRFATDYFPASIDNRNGANFLLYSSMELIEDLQA